MTTKNAFNNVNKDDFEGLVTPWFDDNKRQNVREELVALNDKQDRVHDLIEGIAGLTIQQINKVIEMVDKLRGN